MEKGVQLKIKQRIEIIEGIPCREAIYKRHFVDMLSLNEMRKIYSLSNRILPKLMKEYGFDYRKGSEAVKLQWVDNKQRKIKTSNKLKEVRKWSNPALGCSRPDASERMKVNNPMFDISIREKANKKTIETYNENPKRRNMYHNKLTEREQIIFDFLQSNGIKCIGNELVNGRFIDIYLPDFNIGIECQNKVSNVVYDRHKQICQNNTRIIYCTNNFIKKRNFNILYKYIINGQIFGSLPPIKGEETVIFGRRNGFFFDIDLPQFTIKSINVDSQNILLYTSATNN